MNSNSELPNRDSLNPYASPTSYDELPPSQLVASDDGNGYSLEFSLQFDDYHRFCHYHSLKERVNRRIYLRNWFLLSSYFLAAGLALQWLGNGDSSIGIILMGIGVAYALGYPLLYRYRIHRAMKQVFSRGANLGVLGPRRVVIDLRGIYTQTLAGEHLHYWNSIERIESSETLLMLYITSVSAILIPRRVFVDASEFQNFAEFIRTKRTTETPRP